MKGQGTLTYPDQNSVKGEFHDDKFIKGTYEWPTGK